MDNVVVWRQGIFFIESKFLIPLYIAGEKKENENTGLYFPISIENRLNLSTTAHVIRIIFCILSVWLFFFFLLLLLLSVYFSFFQGSAFSVSSSVFFGMLHLLVLFFFFALYTLEFVTYIFETPFFFLCTNQPSSRMKRYVRHVWDIYCISFTSLLLGSLLLCYPVENSESADRKTALQSGLIWAPFTRIWTKKRRFQKCSD